MKFISVSEFKNRALHTGESYILVCAIGQPLTVSERNNILTQIADADSTMPEGHFKVEDEWVDKAHNYYIKIKVTKNPIWGIAILLALTAVSAYLIGRSLSDTIKTVGVLSQQVVPLAIIGLVGVIVVVAYKWYRKSQK